MQPQILTDADEITRQARAGMDEGWLRALVCAGGDGTVAFAANLTPPGTPLTVLPLGTENLLAKYLGVPADPEAVCELIEQGHTVRLDAGRAGDRIFTLMAGLGFDADVVRRVHQTRTGHIHHLSYAKPILAAIRSYKYPELRVYCEGVPGEAPKQPISARWVFVANLPRYAGGLEIVPEADATDGLIDVCTFKKGSLWNGIQYLFAIFRKRHRGWRSDVRCLRATRVRIESDQPVPYQLDGDFGGTLPVDIEVLPERLTLLVPRSWLAEAGLLMSEATA